MEALCVANKHAEILFFSTFNPLFKQTAFNDFFAELSSSSCDPPPVIRKQFIYVYICRDELYWVCCLKRGSFLLNCGALSVIQNLCEFHQLCAALIGSISQFSVKANSTLLQEVIMETMVGGYMQAQKAEKLQLQIYSKVQAPKESSHINLSPGLFGLEKTAPTTAPHQSLLSKEINKKEVYVDVIERVWTTITPDGTPLRSEVTGTITMHCRLPQTPMLRLSFNTNFSTTPPEGFSPQIHFSEVNFNPSINKAHLDNKRELEVHVKNGETSLIDYTLPSSLPNVLPFSLSASVHQLTCSDAEWRLKLTSNTGMGATAPKVDVKLCAPTTTATVMSRTNGPRQQTVSFSPQDKSVVWSIRDFPGGSYAQAFIRLVDAGEGTVLESAQLEFEVSNWISSGLRIEKVFLQPEIEKVNKWVRYLTVSDTVTFRFN